MSALPTLYSFRRCPYAMRARMALMVSGQGCEIREIILRNKPAEMLEASPKGTVPVLVLPDGAVIDQSLDIMHWALSRHDPEGWLSGIDEALIVQNDGPFKHHLDRYKYHTRHDADPMEHRNACVHILGQLEERLTSHAGLCGEQRMLTDMAIMPFVRQFAATDRTWFNMQKLPHMHKWLTQHEDSLLFRDIMVRLQPWKTGDSPIYFGA